MKKLISILLAVLLLVSVLSMAAFAEDEAYDVIKFNGSGTAESEKGLFTLETYDADCYGWYAGQYRTLLISSKDDLQISRIEIIVSYGGDFYGGWMKNPHSALISCNDGFRPVSFLLETVL